MLHYKKNKGGIVILKQCEHTWKLLKSMDLVNLIYWSGFVFLKYIYQIDDKQREISNLIISCLFEE